MNHVFRLTIRGKEITKLEGPKDANRSVFIKYAIDVLNIPHDEAVLLEITDETLESKVQLQHPSREKSIHNRYIVNILNRHIQNIMATYGEDALMEVLSLKYDFNKKAS